LNGTPSCGFDRLGEDLAVIERNLVRSGLAEVKRLRMLTDRGW
jgi:hypothetical protein